MPVLLNPRDISAGHHVLQTRLAVPLPAYQTRNDINPTLLVSWFCTIMSLSIIFIRLLGRWVRNEKLFIEDKVMLWSIIPLLGRMGFVHVILIWGTNNMVTTGLTSEQIQHRVVGSKLVLPARIFFATYIWVTKITVLEFLEKLVAQSWHKWYANGMRVVYGTLAITWIAVVISTLAACQPFNHYWQVVPDPGSACRAGIAQLITMGVCEIVTDLVLVIFPIPLVLASGMTLRRKMSLISLFFLSLVLVAITAYRVPSTIQRNASQQYRSLLASLEILASTAVANSIVIGSFLRDKGVKKAKFRQASVVDSTLSRVPTTVTTRSKSVARHHWGSDEDLVRDLGMTMPPELRHNSVTADTSKLAPVTEMPTIYDDGEGDGDGEESKPKRPTIDTNWTFAKSTRNNRRRKSSQSSISSASTDIKLKELQSPMEESVSPGAVDRQRSMSFFEANETLDSLYVATQPPADFSTGKSRTFLSDVGGLLSDGPKQDDEISVVPGSSHPSHSTNSLHPRDARKNRQGSNSATRDSSAGRSPKDRRPPAPQPVPQVAPPPQQQSIGSLRNTGPDELNFVDIGGLLK